MRYLITGGCGFLGSNLAHEVLSQDHDLAIFDNLSRLGATKNRAWLEETGDFSFIHGDIRHSHDVSEAVADYRPDVVFHLAGQVAMTTSLANPRLDFDTNVVGSFNLLEAVRRHTPDAIVVFSSTNKVYGELEGVEYDETATRYVPRGYPDGFDETFPFDPTTPYGVSKGAADRYMQDYARMFDLRTVVFRHSSMYGGRQFATADQGWVGWFCQKALEFAAGRKEPITISGTGKQVRDVLHGDDMRRLYFAAVEHIDQAAGRVFNVGGGMKHSLSLLELFSLLDELIGARMRVERGPWRDSDQRVFVADNSQAKTLLGWQPQVNQRVGISQMLEWLRTER
jgi:CDP-paratose 2-epimerase